MKDFVAHAAASLWIKPATLEELAERMEWPEHLTHCALSVAQQKGWIYEKGETFHTYVKTVPILQKRGWDVYIEKPPDVSEFREAFNEYKKNGGI